MDKTYIRPEIKLIPFEVEDIILVSGGNLDEDELPWIPASN